MSKKQKDIKLRKAFASELGMEGIFMNALVRTNAIAGRCKQVKELKKSKKYKKKAKELKN